MKFIQLQTLLALSIVILFSLSLLVEAQTSTSAPTKTPTTTAAPTSPTKSPTIGCNAADKTLWQTKYYWTFETYMDKCGKKSAGDRTIAQKCLADYQQGLTTTCSTCFIDLIVCTRDNCLAPCVNDGQKNPECVSCVELHCNAQFTACSTFLPNQCVGCVQVTSPPTIAAGISNEAIYGIIGGGVAFIFIVAFLIWKFKCCTNSIHAVDATPPPISPSSSSQQLIKPAAPAMPQQMQQYMLQSNQQQQQYMLPPNQQQYMMPSGQQKFVLTPQGYMMVSGNGYSQ